MHLEFKISLEKALKKTAEIESKIQELTSKPITLELDLFGLQDSNSKMEEVQRSHLVEWLAEVGAESFVSEK